MIVRKTLALRGPNVHLRASALEVWVESEPNEDLIEHGDHQKWVALNTGPHASDFKTLDGWTAAKWLEGLMHGLQRAAGAAVSRSCVVPTRDPRVQRVVVEFEDEAVGRRALEVALAIVASLAAGEAVDLEAQARALSAYHQQNTLGPSTRSIVRAAQRRRIPFRRLTSGSMVQFGYGRAQRRIQAAETDRTGAIAQEIAQDKELTRTLLRAVGVPVPDGATVETAEQAWEAAQDVGLPVVVKPRDGNQGRGVATNLNSREEVLAAYEAARAESSTGRVIVETFAPGADYRVLVVGDRVIAAARREPAHVVGDGASTVRTLIEKVNEYPRRGEDHATSLSKIPIDAISLAVLSSQGLDLNSVPAAGQRVLIRRNANLSTGGTACDVTERVHPQVAERCVEAARMIGLDIAGVDVVANDIGQPLESQGGVVVEVNAAPGLRMHLEPSEGAPRAVGEAIIELMYPAGTSGRVPIAAITGVNGKTTVTRMLAHVVRESGKSVGMTCTDGVYINDRCIATGDCSGPASAQAVLANPATECAVLETARGGILRAGLGFDECDVAIVTNIGSGDHLGLSDVQTPEDLARVKSTIVANVANSGAAVLNAADPLVAAMAARCPGSVVFFAIDPDDPVIVDHRERGGRAAFVRHGEIVFAEGPREFGVSRLMDVPITHAGRIGFQVENTLAAAAGAWALGLDLPAIRRGIETFGAESDSLPGRFNLFQIHDATVVVDYGHNTSALEAIIDALEDLPAKLRSIVYSAAGDRRDEDMLEQGAILARHFDRVFLYEDQYRRGRAEGEIMALFQRGIHGGARLPEVQTHNGSLNAIDAALKALRAGELLVVQADTITDTMTFIRHYIEAAACGRELNTIEEIEVLTLARNRELVTIDAD